MCNRRALRLTGAAEGVKSQMTPATHLDRIGDLEHF
jgi:hypothetical protein